MSKIVQVNVDGRNSPRELSNRTLTDAAALVEDCLERLDVRGQFLLRPREQSKMRCHQKIRVSYAIGQAVRLKVERLEKAIEGIEERQTFTAS